jgi:uncharacterized protein
MNNVDITPQNQRFESLDLMRGIAIIGILLINIQSIGFVFSSYFNPFVGDNLTGLNLFSWLFTHIVIDQKFYTIFSMLFGASIVLLASRMKEKGLSPAKYHYRRNFFLLIIGLLHMNLVWYGDILTIYAFLAFFAYFFWRASITTLMAVGGVCVALVVPSFLYFFTIITGETAEVIQTEFWPSAELIATTTEAYKGSWLDNIAQRATMGGDGMLYEMIGIFRIFGCMLIGMALLKMGFINGQYSKERYIKIAKVMLLIGVPFVIASAVLIYMSKYEDAVYARFLLGNLNYIGSFFLALGYIALANIWFKSDYANKAKLRIKAMGQMAFTNYLLQSIIATSVFYGFGFGLFGELSRFEMLMVAASIVLLQFVYSAMWLSKFKMGPLEWVFRMLTYFNLPALVRRDESISMVTNATNTEA